MSFARFRSVIGPNVALPPHDPYDLSPLCDICTDTTNAPKLNSPPGLAGTGVRRLYALHTDSDRPVS